MATHSSILAWKTPRTEEPAGLQSMGSHRIRHDRATNAFTLSLFVWSWCLCALHALQPHGSWEGCQQPKAESRREGALCCGGWCGHTGSVRWVSANGYSAPQRWDSNRDMRPGQDKAALGLYGTWSNPPGQGGQEGGRLLLRAKPQPCLVWLTGLPGLRLHLGHRQVPDITFHWRKLATKTPGRNLLLPPPTVTWDYLHFS